MPYDVYSKAGANVAFATAAQGAKADTAVQPEALATHEADTTAVHGIADTSALVVTTDPRLSDAVLLTSPRPRKPVNTALVTSFQSGHGYTNYNGTVDTLTDDTTRYLMGTQSLRFTTKSDNTAAQVAKAAQPPIATSGKSFRLLLRVDDFTNLTEIVFYAGSDTMASYYQWNLADADPTFAQHLFKSGEWFWFTLGFQDAFVIGTPTRDGFITQLRLRARASNGNTVAVNWGAVALTDESTAYPNGVVSFTYDDSYLSHWTEARKALDKQGYVGTFYTICDLVDSGASWMTTQQLKNLQRAGHEIAAHAYTLADHQTGFHNMTDAALAEDLRLMRRWLTDRGFTGGDHLAWPQGGYTPATLDVTRKFFASARTVNRRTLETLRPADALRLRSFSVSNTDTEAQVKAKIDATKANRSWLVLTFHDLVVSPGNGNQFPITTHQNLVDYCAAQGIAVLPVGEVLRTAT